jgi:methyltransferase (TIGR00027 family)
MTTAMTTAVSRTALATSLMRAWHTRRDPKPLIDDAYGEQLVPEQVRAGYQDPMTLRGSAAYAGVILRTRYTEDALRTAVANGVRQYLILGAGFDSFALRLPAFARHLRIYEIDHPVTQALKRQRLRDCGLIPPSCVQYLAADLSQEELPAALARASFDPTVQTFVSWLGVTMYLTRAANLATLRAIAQSVAPGSELVFTYFDLERGLQESGRVRALSERVAALGEPFRSGFDPATLGADLRGCGWTLREDLTDCEVLARVDDADSNDLNPGGFSHVVRAAVDFR